MKPSLTIQQWIAILLAVVLPCTSCTVMKVRKLEVTDVAQPQQEHIVGITTKKGEEVRFDPPGGSVDKDAIAAKVKNTPYTIPIRDVQRLWVERRGISAPRTIGLTAAIVVGVLATIAAVVLLTKQSCPFVYSWDGTQYVFDAEPYGGAITRGLERDDYSELEHLREQDGLYRLLLTNEVDETQFTNLMELWVVDHAPGSRVVSDEKGNLRGFANVQQLSAARDLYGNDLLPWLQFTDRKIWEPDAVAGPDGSLRQEVILSFPKPEGVKQANLLANAATGLWGSYMIKRMVELHGREAAGWLSSLDQDPASVAALEAWGAREETYRLRVEIEEPTGWELRGTMPPGGPLLAEDRWIPLDISHVPGTRLRIRLRPPVGFWALNSFAVAYGEGQELNIRRIAAKSAVTWEHKDVLADLAGVDDRYYPMPYTTDRAELTFPAPPRNPGMLRTVFLHSRGWYQLHLNSNGEPDNTTLMKLMSVPGAPVQFAVDRFAEWRQSGGR
jgi:hypothetical protein